MHAETSSSHAIWQVTMATQPTSLLHTSPQSTLISHRKIRMAAKDMQETCQNPST